MGAGEAQQRNQHRTPARVSPGGRDHAFWTKACERVGDTESAPRFRPDADDEEINTMIAAEEPTPFPGREPGNQRAGRKCTQRRMVLAVTRRQALQGTVR